MNDSTAANHVKASAKPPETFPPYTHRQSDLLSDAMIINTLMINSEDMIYFKDVRSRFILNNRAHAARFGVTDPRDLKGKSDADFYPEVIADILYQNEMEIMRTGIPQINQMEQEILPTSNLLALSSSKYPLYDQNDKIIGTWGVSRDMSHLARTEAALEKANERLEALSLVDELSGLYNQRHFYNSLTSAIKFSSRKRADGLTSDFCLIFVDIDYFKLINDTYGHVIGDAAIRYAAGLMMANTRSSDTSYRYGGDEYAFILPDTSLPAGRDLAERLRMIIRHNPLTIDGTTIKLTLSLGVVCFDNEKTAGELVEKADARLYQAKKEGRNRVC